MGLSLITPPVGEPITTAEAKEHLIVTETDDDSYIAALISAATLKLENDTSRRFLTQTWDYYMDEFPDSDELILPYPPLQSITSIKYLDTNGVEQTFAAADYIVDTYSEEGRIALDEGESWPSTQPVINAVYTRMVVGYGLAASVPEALKHALKLYLSLLYENREPIVMGTIVSKIPDSIGALVSMYRILRFA